jgi:ribosomal-protein-alanine N-acetyltransferase
VSVAITHRSADTAGSIRLVGAADATALAELFAEIDISHFHPHPMTPAEAARLAAYVGDDVYAVLEDGRELVAYGLLRGWDEGYAVPSLGIAVRTSRHGQGFGRQMMTWLEEEARRRGARQIRLRVSDDNVAARNLYESRGFVASGVERGETVMLLELPT